MDKLLWVGKFLSVANKAVTEFSNTDQATFFDHMNCSVNIFATAVKSATAAELNQAMACVNGHYDWDQSSLIMSLQNKK